MTKSSNSDNFSPKNPWEIRFYWKFSIESGKISFTISKFILKNSCNPFFVRCIKPNNSKQAMKFEMKVVLEQLNYTGMLETIRIRKLGFPIRYKFQFFITRYHALIGNKPANLDTAKDLTIFILSKLDPKFKLMYQIGLTKVSQHRMLYTVNSCQIRPGSSTKRSYWQDFTVKKNFNKSKDYFIFWLKDIS